MKNQILCALAAVALATGCAETRKHAGATAENDHNVLTGGPVTGTRLVDLPQAVKDALQKRLPSAEVADIDKQSKEGRTVYKVSFIEPGTNPTLFISEDGRVLKEGFNSDSNEVSKGDSSPNQPTSTPNSAK